MKLPSIFNFLQHQPFHDVVCVGLGVAAVVAERFGEAVLFVGEGSVVIHILHIIILCIVLPFMLFILIQKVSYVFGSDNL